MTGKSAKLLAVIAVALSAAVQANALTIDFDEFSNGDIVNSSQGVAISANNFSFGPDLAVAFDSELMTPTSDWDLRRGEGWAAGNLAPDTVLNRILIVQQHSESCSATHCSDPDDQPTPGGTLTLDLDALGIFESFAFDLVDVDGVYSDDEIPAENGLLLFFLDGVQVGSAINFNSFLGLGQGVVFGDNSANHIDLGTVAAFDKVKIVLAGSGAIDNVTVSPIIPEPDTLALFGLGVAGLTVSGRKRR